MLTTSSKGPLRVASPNQMNSPCLRSSKGVPAGRDSRAPQNGVLATACAAKPESPAAIVSNVRTMVRRLRTWVGRMSVRITLVFVALLELLAGLRAQFAPLGHLRGRERLLHLGIETGLRLFGLAQDGALVRLAGNRLELRAR